MVTTVVMNEKEKEIFLYQWIRTSPLPTQDTTSFFTNGFEQVCAPRAAVSDVVPHQIRHHGWVARVVFGNAGLHLAHQVRAHVGSLLSK